MVVKALVFLGYVPRRLDYISLAGHAASRAFTMSRARSSSCAPGVLDGGIPVAHPMQAVMIVSASTVSPFLNLRKGRSENLSSQAFICGWISFIHWIVSLRRCSAWALGAGSRD